MGTFIFDGRVESRVETLFRFFSQVNAISLPDGKTYRLKNEVFEEKDDNGNWVKSEATLNYILEVTKDFDLNEWAKNITRTVSGLNTLFNWPTD